MLAPPAEATFIDLCRDCLIRQYGIKTLALKQLKQLIATIVCDENRLRSARLATFAQLVGTVESESSPRSVAVFVKVLRRLRAVRRRGVPPVRADLHTARHRRLGADRCKGAAGRPQEAGSPDDAQGRQGAHR